MLKIAVLNTKGGVGKTTLCCALSVREAQAGKRVALVDLDPQRSLIDWWKRRGATENPAAYEGVDTPLEAIERLEHAGAADVVFFDGPPAFVTLMQEMADVADIVVIPIKASVLDLVSTQDAVVITRRARKPLLVVINDVGPYEAKMVASARETLAGAGIPVAHTVIRHRPAHIAAMTLGKSGPEIDRGKDKHAASDIEALWTELHAVIAESRKTNKKRVEVAHG